MTHLVRVAHRPGGQDNDVPEQLLGQIPVPGRCAAAHVGRPVEAWDQHPRVVENLRAVEQIQRGGDVGAMGHPAEPALPGPAGEKLGGLRPVDRQDGLHVGGTNDLTSALYDRDEPAPPARDRLWLGDGYCTLTVIIACLW